MDGLLTGRQLNRGYELVSARDWFRLALGTDGSMGIYRTITPVNACFPRIPARLVADWIAEMLVKIRLAGKMNTPRT